MAEKKQKLPLLTWRGTLGDNSRRQRVMAFASQAVLAASLIFSQIGFVGITLPNENSTYVIAILLPMALVSMMLGPGVGGLFGVLCGAVLALHADVQPHDYIELTAITPETSCVMFGLTGLVLGLLFAIALRGRPKGWRRVMRIGLVCMISSAIFTIMFLICSSVLVITDYTEALGGTVDSLSSFDRDAALTRVFSLGNPQTQGFIDAILMMSACWIEEALQARLGIDNNARPLHATFNIWLFMAVFMGYMVVTSWGFVVITERERQMAANDMREEIEYLEVQRKAQNQRGVLYAQSTLGSSDVPENVRDIFRRYFSASSLLDGYETTLDGTVVVAYGIDENAEIVATTNGYLTVGNTLADELEPDTLVAVKASLETGELQSMVYDYVSDVDTEDFTIARLGYLMAARSGYAKELGIDPTAEDYTDPSTGYLYFIIRPAEMVFADRIVVVRWVAQTSFVLMALVYLLVSRLLSQVVVSPMSCMGEELDAICDGRLDTVVDASGSEEFVNLSNGINTTVDRLKQWIAEAERRIDQELATARAIQSSALPSLFPPFPEIGAFDLYASMQAAREVGGDFYDFFLTEEDTVAFLVADVSGKGIPGALFMMAAKAELDNFLMTGMDLADAVKRSNERLCEGNDAEMFVTAWVATLNYRTGELTYVNAGHNPPLLRHQGEWRWVRDKSGLFMAAFETAKFKSFELTLEPGDELLLYTDGVNEAFSAEGEEYGNDRLEAFLAAHNDLGPEELVDALREDVARWAEGAEQSDDITIMALEYHPDSAC